MKDAIITGALGGLLLGCIMILIALNFVPT
ncbi:hypothetical protein Kallioja_00007 [Pseudomonas phage vB_PpuP-Kallioja]